MKCNKKSMKIESLYFLKILALYKSVCRAKQLILWSDDV